MKIGCIVMMGENDEALEAYRRISPGLSL